MIAVVKSAPLDGPEGTEVRDCPVPKPGHGEVLIRVAGTAICGTDKHIYHWDPSIRGKVQPPRIYGHEFCPISQMRADAGRRDSSKRHFTGYDAQRPASVIHSRPPAEVYYGYRFSPQLIWTGVSHEYRRAAVIDFCQ